MLRRLRLLALSALFLSPATTAHLAAARPAAAQLAAGQEIAVESSPMPSDQVEDTLLDVQPAPAGPAAPVKPGPLAREVGELQETFNRRLQELTARYAAAADQTAASALQREIAVLKEGLEADMIALQLRHARSRQDDPEAYAAIPELEQTLAVLRARWLAADDAGAAAETPHSSQAPSRPAR